MIKFLDLQQVTAKYKDEIHEAVNRVIDSGWYLQVQKRELRFYTFLRCSYQS